MNKLLRAAASSALVIVTSHGVARAEVIVDSAASAVVRFLNFEERTAETPFGMHGLRLRATSAAFTSIAGAPSDGFTGTVTSFASAQDGVDGLPPVGGTWDAGQTMSLVLNEAGHGAVSHQVVLDLVFLNVTDGASVFAIDLEIEWVMKVRVERAIQVADTAVLYASAHGLSASGRELAPLAGLSDQRDSTTPETTSRGVSRVHIEVGRTEADPLADLGRVQLTFTMQGYVSSVPAAGPVAVLGIGLAVVGVRRLRR